MTRESIRRAFFAACIVIVAAYVGMSIAAPGLALCLFRGIC